MIELTPEVLANLRKKAEAASKGPWLWANGALMAPTEVREWDDNTSDYDDGRVIWDPNVFHVFRGPQDKAFIAAANPAVLLALLDRIATLERLLGQEKHADPP